MSPKPRLAVWKFTSCDGCQLTVLDCEEEFLDLLGSFEIALFHEARREFEPGPYDVSLVEGSIGTPAEAERIKMVREQTKFLIPFGVCATWGGIQALRNWSDAERMKSQVYPHPQYVSMLPTSTPVWAHVKIDYQLQGCPPNRGQLIDILGQILQGKQPRLATNSVCLECKRKGNICVLVAQNMTCLGPVTHDGCGALCPTYNKGCYGCFGPMDDPKPERFARELEVRGLKGAQIVREFMRITSYAEGYRKGAELYEPEIRQG
ncbi:MAG: oxidoreductase [Chloroflexi bacterium]|nr:oxidoreductase [Chloroflexota bacterium]